MNRPVLIAGAGPTGLAAALFLHERGVTSRIIDAAAEPAGTSKALGVNPRTLDLLEPSGVTEQILARALPITAMRLHQGGKLLAEVTIDPMAKGARFPFVILPQSETERLLTAALAGRGIKVERNLALTEFDQDGGGVDYTLTDGEGGELDGRAAVVLGADGAHSAVRDLLGVGFPGSSFPEPWQIVDCAIDQPDPQPQGRVDLQRAGPWIALPYDGRTWRLIGSGPDLVTRLPRDWSVTEVLWRSEFHIAHRTAGKMAEGRVCLAGDAAHIHSPLGARGMNLGIEDAYVLAACAADALKSGTSERLADYDRIRREVDGAVVRRVERLTRAVRARGMGARLLRRWLIPAMARPSKAAEAFTRTATGLDHPVRLT